MKRGAIEIAGVGKEFGTATVLNDVDLAIAGGSFVTLLGPSGCGKTTLLRLIAGFLEPSRGAIAIDGAAMQGVPPRQRPIGMVFQNLALFPHLDVFDNVAYGLKVRGAPAGDIAGRVGSAEWGSGCGSDRRGEAVAGQTWQGGGRPPRLPGAASSTPARDCGGWRWCWWCWWCRWCWLRRNQRWWRSR